MQSRMVCRDMASRTVVDASVTFSNVSAAFLRRFMTESYHEKES